MANNHRLSHIMSRYRLLTCLVVLAAVILVLAALALKLQATTGGNAVAVQLARSFLRGLSTLSASVANSWFLLTVACLGVFEPDLIALIQRIVKGATGFEVGGLKVQFLAPDLAGLTDKRQLCQATVGTWQDRLGIPAQDLAGSDGPVMDEPPCEASYWHCISEIRHMFTDLSVENMPATGDRLKEIEGMWAGEYAHELELSSSYLRFEAHRQRVQLTGYLSVTLLFRHLMLFFYGRDEHAEQLVEDLAFIAPTDRARFLESKSAIWVLLHLCRAKRVDLIDRLKCWQERDGSPTLIQMATLMMNEYTRGRFERVVECNDHTLPSVSSLTGATLLFRFLVDLIIAQSLLELERPAEAVTTLNWLVIDGTTPDRTDPTLHSVLKLAAVETLAAAHIQLDNWDALHRIYLADSDAKESPILLYGLALLSAKAGAKTQAKHFLRQARAAIRSSDHSTLKNAMDLAARNYDI